MERLSVREGISVGHGDNYRAFLEGQSLRLNGLRSGRYVLVHRVNVDRRLRERSYDNNASSAAPRPALAARRARAEGAGILPADRPLRRTIGKGSAAGGSEQEGAARPVIGGHARMSATDS